MTAMTLKYNLKQFCRTVAIHHKYLS